MGQYEPPLYGVLRSARRKYRKIRHTAAAPSTRHLLSWMRRSTWRGWGVPPFRGRRRGMSAEENKAVSRRVVEELFNEGDLDAADELFTSDYVCYVAGFEDLHGVEGIKGFAGMYRQAFPDLKETIEEQVAEGEKGVTFFRA